MKTAPLFLWTIACGSLAAVLGAAPASGDPIVGYTFTSAIQAPAQVADGVTATNFLNGPGLSGANQTIYRQNPTGDYTVLARGVDSLNASNDTAEEALTNNAYWHFTVTPDDGQTISPGQLKFDTLWYANNPQATIFVRSSVDSFAENLGSFAVDTQSRTTRTIDLPAAFQNLDEPLTFRFYIYATNGRTTAYTAGVDNVQLIVPEPASVGLVAFGSLSALWRR